MFSDGPYYMGLLKTGVPDQSGKWKIAIAPYSKQPGSYLGGTGLGIPVQAAAQGGRLAAHPVPARAGEAGRRLHLRRRRAGDDGRPGEPRAEQGRSVLRRRCAVQGLPRHDGDVHARSRTSGRGPTSTPHHRGAPGGAPRPVRRRRRPSTTRPPRRTPCSRSDRRDGRIGRSGSDDRDVARRFRGASAGYLLIAPAVLTTVVFLLIPMIVSGYWSLTHYNGIRPPQSGSGSTTTSTS